MRTSPADGRPRVGRAGRTAHVAAGLSRLLWAAIVDLAWAAVAGLAIAALVHASGVRAWPLELVHHFVPVYLAGAATLLLFALTVRNPRMTAATGLLFCFFVWAMTMPGEPLATPPAPVLAASGASPSFAPGMLGADPAHSAPDSASPGRTLSVITNNVFCGNWDRHGMARWLRSRPADVVVLQEVPVYLNRALTGLEEAYPYEARLPSVPRKDAGVELSCRGIIVLSVYPIVSSTVFQPVEEAWPALIAKLSVADTRVTLAVVHAADPIRLDGLIWRDRFLDRLAARLETVHTPLIVLGDFNATPFSPAFRAFQAEARLALSGWNPGTYPANLGTFGIGIDHVLVRDATLLRVYPLPAIGSDHRPLRASIALPAAPAGVPAGLVDGGDESSEAPPGPNPGWPSIGS